MIGVDAVVDIAHEMEAVLRLADRGSGLLSLSAVEVLLKGVKAIEIRVAAFAAGKPVPTAPQARTSSHTSLGRNAADNTVVPPTSIGANTDGAALRWNNGMAVHSTSPASISQQAATAAAAENR